MQNCVYGFIKYYLIILLRQGCIIQYFIAYYFILKLFSLVPHGTFTKFNINLSSEFVSPLSSLNVDNYADLVSFNDSYKKIKDTSSLKSAFEILKFNTQYPVDASIDLDQKVSDIYKR